MVINYEDSLLGGRTDKVHSLPLVLSPFVGQWEPASHDRTAQMLASDFKVPTNHTRPVVHDVQSDTAVRARWALDANPVVLDDQSSFALSAEKPDHNTVRLGMFYR